MGVKARRTWRMQCISLLQEHIHSDDEKEPREKFGMEGNGNEKR